MHYIEKHILKTLCYCKWARFRDMKPKNVDSNLYNYHLKLLMKDEMIEKLPGRGYRLLPKGMRFIDHVSIKNVEPRLQPKLLTKIVSINSDNEILLWPKHKQPFIGQWSLPSGKMHYDDSSVEHAVRREIRYMTLDEPRNLQHRGIVEFQAAIAGTIVSHTIAHVFTASLTNVRHDFTKSIPLVHVPSLMLSPGTKETIEATYGHSTFFYEKYDFDRSADLELSAKSEDL